MLSHICGQFIFQVSISLPIKTPKYSFGNFTTSDTKPILRLLVFRSSQNSQARRFKIGRQKNAL